MRNRSRGFSSADMKGFIFETVSLSPGGPKGRWFTTEEKNISDKRHFPWPNIWHDSKPTSVLRNAVTEDVISLIESTVFINLMSEACHEPIELPPWLNLRETASNGDIHLYTEELSPSSLSILAIKMVLDCVYHLWINRKYPDPMIHWTTIPSGSSTFPSAEFPFSPSELSGHDVAGVLQVLRHVGPYEGGTDYMFERRLMSAISLLFSSYNVGYTNANSKNKSSGFPIVVIGDFGPLTVDIKRRMAMLAEPTLLELIARHKDSASPLPNHTFVFGIHLSRHMLSIFVHVPARILNTKAENCDGTDFEFHQIAVTYHNVTALQPEYSDVIHPDDRFLDRWQVLVALLTIRSHVQRLHELLGSPSDHSGVHSELLVNELPPDLRCSVDKSVLLTEYISAIRQSWKGEHLAVPWRWIPEDDHVVHPMREHRWGFDMVSREMQNLLSMYLYPIRDMLIPLTKEELWSNHLSDTYFAPDFLHRPHVPRFNMRAEWLELDDQEADSTASLSRLCDMLMMTTVTWADVNVFIACMFSSFSEYSVIWDPCIRYPFDIRSAQNDSIVLDFALAVQKIPATTESTVERARTLPLTLSTPAVVLGLRASETDRFDSGLTDSELDTIQTICRPHLQLLLMHLRHQARETDDPIIIPSWTVVFSLYLKPGRLYILASYPNDWMSNFTIATSLVDSLPIQRTAQTNDDLGDRLRLAIALFSLQHHVVHVSRQLTNIWPDDLLVEEHEVIVQATGICTPNLSEDGDSVEETTDKKRERIERVMNGGTLFSEIQDSIPYRTWGDQEELERIAREDAQKRVLVWLEQTSLPSSEPETTQKRVKATTTRARSKGKGRARGGKKRV